MMAEHHAKQDAMRLSAFIRAQVEPLVQEWAEFARTSSEAGRLLPDEELRDHAGALLLQIASEMETRESEREAMAVSRGERPSHAPHINHLAREDARQRFDQGFTLNEMLAEYRALRTSVLHRWLHMLDECSLDTLHQACRFDECVDQAVREAVDYYRFRAEESRDIMLGVIGHDLRNPLGAIVNSAEALLRSGTLAAPQQRAATLVQSSAQRMQHLLEDLLDFTRTRLGRELPITVKPADLGKVCRQALDELQAMHPAHDLVFLPSGDLNGVWDTRRLVQLVSNLVANAIQHGHRDSPVTISAYPLEGDVRLEINSHGPPIDPHSLRLMGNVEPDARMASHRNGSSGLGLGLFIVREIVRAHGGRMHVESDAKLGNTFVVTLPRGV
jgi:signal transduction histidine kinase